MRSFTATFFQSDFSDFAFFEMKFPIAFSVLLFALTSAQSGSDIWEPEYTVDSETMQEAITFVNFVPNKNFPLYTSYF